MNLSFLFPDKNLEDKSQEHPLVHSEPAYNTSEGSEFLDDALYMHDQPLMYTEENIATGYPENLV